MVKDAEMSDPSKVDSAVQNDKEKDKDSSIAKPLPKPSPAELLATGE